MNTLDKVIIVTLMSTIISACGGGGGSESSKSTASNNDGGGTSTVPGNENTSPPPNNTDDPATEEPDRSVIAVAGMGIKGPLIDAIATVYKIDTTKQDFKGDVIAEGVTNKSAALLLDIETQYSSEPLFLLEYTQGTELNGTTPVLPSLRTIISSTQLINKIPVYATPLTTLVVDYAIQSADLVDTPNVIENNRDGLSGNNDGSVTTDEFISAISSATRYVKGTFGLGVMDDDIDLFTSSPVLSGNTDQNDTFAYRTAIEVFAAVMDSIRKETVDNGGTINTNILIEIVARDMVDGTIDGEHNGQAISQISAVSKARLQQLYSADPSTLTIPGTNRTIADLDDVIRDETQTVAPNVTPISLTTINPVRIDLDYGASTSPTSTSISLAWDTPVRRTNSLPIGLSEIDGYEIYYFKDGTPANEGEVVQVPAKVNDAAVIQHLVAVTESGTWIFAIASYDVNGLYSEISDSISIVIQ